MKLRVSIKTTEPILWSYDVLKNKPTTESTSSILIQNSLWDILLWCCIYLSADEPILASSIHCQIKENRLKKHLILHLLWCSVWRLCRILQRPSKTNKEFNVAMKKSKNEFFMNVWYTTGLFIWHTQRMSTKQILLWPVFMQDNRSSFWGIDINLQFKCEPYHNKLLIKLSAN